MKKEDPKRFGCAVCDWTANYFIMYVGSQPYAVLNNSRDDADPDDGPFALNPGQAVPICNKCLESNPDPNPNSLQFRVLGFDDYHKAQLKYLIEQSMDWVSVYLDDADTIRSCFNDMLDKYIAESVMES